jgi:AraC family transcriptional regulator
LAAFLDRMAADLGAGTDATARSMGGAEELAADAQLSRFHFERVISSTAGETPTRFRSRILMERAAYLMITTQQTLLDIALTAGFASHEAFTRAFRREFGDAPAAWRRRPGDFRIAAPSDVHFHPPGGLRLPARQRMDSMDLIVEMVEHHAWLAGELVTRAERLTADQLDAPLPHRIDGIDGETLRHVLSRIVGQMGMWDAAVADREYDFTVEQDESIASMRQRLATTGPEFVANVRRYAVEGRLDETFVDAFSPLPQVLSYGAMVAHVLAFGTHHRIVAVTALREHGIGDLGYGDPKDWFASPRE